MSHVGTIVIVLFKGRLVDSSASHWYLQKGPCFVSSFAGYETLKYSETQKRLSNDLISQLSYLCFHGQSLSCLLLYLITQGGSLETNPRQCRISEFRKPQRIE